MKEKSLNWNQKLQLSICKMYRNMSAYNIFCLCTYTVGARKRKAWPSDIFHFYCLYIFQKPLILSIFYFHYFTVRVTDFVYVSWKWLKTFCCISSNIRNITQKIFEYTEYSWPMAMEITKFLYYDSIVYLPFRMICMHKS